MIYNVWEILGISPTSDKKEIKKAYAKQSALYHPEEHPEEFNRLYNAYKTALKIAGSGRIAPAPDPSDQTAPKTDGNREEAQTQDASEGEPPREADDSENGQPPALFTPGGLSKNQATAIPTAPEIPSISQLVEEGAAKETEAAAGKLMEKLKALHASFPRSVNTNKTELNNALERLEMLFESQWFDIAGWDPVFLNQLDHWLAENRDHINRAETVALFRAYRFQQYGSPSYPTVPYLSNVHWEVMQQATHFQKEMTALTGMKRQNSSPNRGQARKEVKTRSFLPLFLFVIIIFIFKIAASVPSNPDKPKNIDEYRRKIMANASTQASQWENIRVLETTPPATQETHAPAPANPQNWDYAGYGPIKRYAMDPVSSEEYEYYGKNQLTIAYKGSNILKSSGWIPTSPTGLIFTCHTVWGMRVNTTFLLDNEISDSTTVYNMETLGEPSLPFQMWLEPLETEGASENAVQIGGCSYWSELFLYYAAQAGIEGRTWYDEDHNAHMALKWDSVQTSDELARRLVDAYSQYYDYVEGLTPYLNLTILYGPDTDHTLDALEALEKPQKDGLTYVTISEKEQLERCGPSPKPPSGPDGAPAPLLEYDGGMRWISRLQLKGGDHEHLVPEEILSQLTKELESLDWALSRYELKSDETPIN